MSNLSELLRLARESNGWTLREAESGTGISNAYLSQIEKGKVGKPSPMKLKKLSEFYKVDYEKLMQAAGHENPGTRLKKGSKKVSDLENFLKSQKLSEDEMHAMISFLKAYRSTKTGKE